MGEPSVLDSEASAGVGTEPLRLSFALLVKGKVDEMAIGLSLVDLDVALRVLAQMEELSLMIAGCRRSRRPSLTSLAPGWAVEIPDWH